MMRSTWKRALSTILTVCMIASLLVVPAAAVTDTGTNGYTDDTKTKYVQRFDDGTKVPTAAGTDVVFYLSAYAEQTGKGDFTIPDGMPDAGVVLKTGAQLKAQTLTIVAPGAGKVTLYCCPSHSATDRGIKVTAGSQEIVNTHWGDVNGKVAFNVDANTTYTCVKTGSQSSFVYAVWEATVASDNPLDAKKDAVEMATYTVAQADIADAAAAKAKVEEIAATAVADNGVTVEASEGTYTASEDGTPGNPHGTDGTFVFTVTLSNGGTNTPVTTAEITMKITAKEYTPVANSEPGEGYGDPVTVKVSSLTEQTLATETETLTTEASPVRLYLGGADASTNNTYKYTSGGNTAVSDTSGITYEAGSIAGSQNPVIGGDNIPTGGSYYKFVASEAGKLEVLVKVNANKTLKIVKADGTTPTGTVGSVAAGGTNLDPWSETFEVEANGTYYVYASGGTKMPLYGFTFWPVAAVEEPSVADKAASDLAAAIGGEGEAPALNAISFDDTLDTAVSTDENDLKANSDYLTGIVRTALETKLGAERTVDVNVLTATYTAPTAPEVQLLATAEPAGSIAYTAELVNKADASDKAEIGGTISLLAEPAVEPDANVTGAVTKAPVGLGDESATLAPDYAVSGTPNGETKTTDVKIGATKLVKHPQSQEPKTEGFWLGFGMENTEKKAYTWKYSKDGTTYSPVTSVKDRYVTVGDKNYNTVYVEVDKDLTEDHKFVMQQCTEDGATVLWTYNVTVDPMPTLVQDYNITKATAENGSFTVKVGENEVEKAQNGATVTVTPAADATYELDKITVTKTDDTETTVAVDADAHTFTMPEYPVTITVTFKGVPSVTAVAIKKDGAEIAGNALTATYGDEPITLTAEVTGNHLVDADKAVTWASSAADVATVADGKVTILKAGTTNITATSVKDNTVSSTAVALTVNKAAAPTLTVTSSKAHLGPVGGEVTITIAGVPTDSAVAPTLACDPDTGVTLGAVTKSGDNYTATVTLPKNESDTAATYTVKANWAGDDNYAQAAEATHDIVVDVAGAIILNVIKSDAPDTVTTVTSGGTLKFEVTVHAVIHESDGTETPIDQANVTFKWSVKDGADIEGETGNAYSINPATVAENNGKTYVCTVTATNGKEGAEAKTLTKTAEFTATVTKKAGTEPTAAFDAGTMKLTGLAAGQEYSVDGGSTWETVAESTTEADLTNVTAENGIKVKAPADTETEEAVQTITVTKAETPALTAGDQQITITNFVESATYQIKSGVKAYADATVTAGVISGLINDTEYTVRVKAAGTTLASDEATATPVAAAPEPRTLTFAVDTGATVTDVTVGGTATTMSGNTLAVAKDAVVTFKVSVTDDTKELKEVKVGDTAIEAAEGVYTVAAAETDATVTVTLQAKTVTPGAAYKMGYAVLPEDTLTTTAETEIPTGVVGVKLSAGANSTYTMHFDITSGDYVGYLQGSANPVGAGATDVPTGGSYYKFAVEKDGKLVIDYVIAGNGKTAYVVKKPATGANTNVVTVTGSKEAKQVVINDAVAGDTYYVVISGSKVGLMGFTFETELTDAEKPDYKLDEGKTAAAGATYNTTLADTPDAAAAEKLAKETAAAAVNNHNVTVSIVDGAWTDPAAGGNGTYKFKVKLTTANGETVTTDDEITMTIVAGKLVETITVTAAEGATEVMEGKTLQLSAAVTPDDADNKAVEWSSSDETKATVSETGLVTGVAPGAVKITATAKDGSDVKGEIDLTVTDDPTTEKYIFNSEDFDAVNEDTALTAADFDAKYPNDIFSLTAGATVNKRPDSSTKAVQIAKKQAGGIDFKVPEGTTAKVTMVVSSTGSNNVSDVVVKKAGTVVPNDQNVTTVTNSSPRTTLTWTDLAAGTYTLCTDGSNEKDLRVYTITVETTTTDPVVEKVTVTYEAKDAEGNAVTGVTLPAGGEVDKNTSVTLTAPTAPTGYTFDGWFVGETEITEPTYTVTADTTFTAKFTKITVTPGLDLEALNAAITAAKAVDVTGVKVSEDGTDVLTTEKWIAKSVKDTFDKALADAEEAVKTATTQKAVDDAAKALTDATAALKTAIENAKNGTKELAITYTFLHKTVVYTGEPQTIEAVVTVPAEGVTITYAKTQTGAYTAEPITLTDAGEQVIWVKIEAEGYKTANASAKLTVTKVAAPELTIEASNDNIHSAEAADRKVTFTVTPADLDVEITCDKTVTFAEDGSVTLDDVTAEYVFTATYAGDKNHEGASAQAKVYVTKSDEVNKTELKQAIEATTAKMEGVVPAESAADVAKGEMWATQTAIDTLTDAIEAAQAVVDKAEATEAEVTAAVTTLKAAADAFVPAEGTKTADKKALEDAIKAAEDALTAAKDSENGADVLTSETWISAADKADLQAMIDAAKALGDDKTQAEIDAAAKALTDAVKDMIKNGNKSTGSGGYRPSGSSTPAGTGTKTETLPDGTKRVTETAKDGTVTVTQTKPDGSKIVTTTDKDGNVTGTVTVPGNVDKTTVSVPVDDANTGMVAVIVNPDGTEEIIRNTSVEDGEVVFPMSESGKIKIVNNAKHFVDIDQHWAEDEVNFVSARELFNGVDATHFAPDATMTRGMMATVLFRLDGESKSEKSGDFSDVTAGDWFADAVDWAAEIGVINGYTDGTFGPNRSITREELVVMIYRYAKTPEAEAANMSVFTDADQVSDWAAEAMNWAVKTGIINGKGNGILDPKGNATRAEVSAVLERFVKLANQ